MKLGELSSRLPTGLKTGTIRPMPFFLRLLGLMFVAVTFCHAAQPLTVTGSSTPELYLEESEELIMLGNAQIEVHFDRKRGGVLCAIVDKRQETRYALEGQKIQGEWVAELEQGALTAATMEYEGGTGELDGAQAVLTLISRGPMGRLIHTYRLRSEGDLLKSQCRVEAEQPFLLKTVRFALEHLVLDDDLAQNEYLYPPTWLHLMRGPVAGSTWEVMNQRYIYGVQQPTDKLMLPFVMLHQRETGAAIALAAFNSQAKVLVGAVGGEAGRLQGEFFHFRKLTAAQTQEAGTVCLTFPQGGWKAAFTAQRTMLMEEVGYRAPKTLPALVKDLVIIWHGIPGVGVMHYDDLAKDLGMLHEVGANAVIVGGKVWACPATGKGEGTILDYIPVPQNGRVVPGEDVGGAEGFHRLVTRAHELGMKLFAWGPVSMAGIARQSQEATKQPDWWIYKEDGSFNDWYSFMAPANPQAVGWRRFVAENVRQLLTEYRLDGFWLDSSWQDHQLNAKAVDGWQGAPNGAKYSLLDEIVAAAKAVNPDAVMMGEIAGAEAMSRLDLAYLQVHGIWPAIDPSLVQEMIEAQELCRLPGVRPFGQIELGQGFYPELGDATSRELADRYSDSWIAKTFLVSTMERVPVYFGMNWGLAILKQASPEGSPEEPAVAKALHERALYTRWYEQLRRINSVRSTHRVLIDGATHFDEVEASQPNVVHFVRATETDAAIVLLNAGKEREEVAVSLKKAERFGVKPSERYRVVNLMNGEALGKDGETSWSGEALLASGLTLSLEGYEGAVLTITRLEAPHGQSQTAAARAGSPGGLPAPHSRP